MHPTPIFTNDDRGQALSFAASYPFATLAVNGETGPVTALVPLTLTQEGDTFLGHVAKANPFWKAAQKAGQAVAVFRGPDLKSLTARMESHRDLPWKMSDAPADYMVKLSNAIVGFSLSVEAFHFVEKLSQNKSEAETMLSKLNPIFQRFMAIVLILCGTLLAINWFNNANPNKDEFILLIAFGNIVVGLAVYISGFVRRRKALDKLEAED